MLSHGDIIKYLEVLNEKMKEKEIRGQIALFGGTVMCLVYHARPSTKDIDAIFEPKQAIYQIASEIAEEFNLESDWLNDSVKGFVSANNETRVFKDFSHLTVYVPSAEYMLAMKCMAARIGDTHDVTDIKFLLNYLNIKETEAALNIIAKYFPERMIQPKTKYMLMELLEEE
ncbi:MAG: DUF6036 family nucleotidyltransferase [Thermotaleaceae bacterium]